MGAEVTELAAKANLQERVPAGIGSGAILGCKALNPLRGFPLLPFWYLNDTGIWISCNWVTAKLLGMGAPASRTRRHQRVVRSNRAAMVGLPFMGSHRGHPQNDKGRCTLIHVMLHRDDALASAEEGRVEQLVDIYLDGILE